MKKSKLMNRRRFVKYFVGGTLLVFGAGLASNAMAMASASSSCSSGTGGSQWCKDGLGNWYQCLIA
jgi:hypothetical protein